MEVVAVIDFETTGLSPAQGDRATEVAAVIVEDGRVVDRYQSLMNAGVRIPAFIEALTGISNAMVRSAPPAGEVMREVSDFVGDIPIVAHNASFDAKFWGVVAMGGAVIILFFLPWLDQSPVKSIRYRPTWHKVLYAIFVVNFIVLGYLGVLPPFPVGERVSQLGTLFYFGFFLLMPWWSKLGQFKPVPERITYKPH